MDMNFDQSHARRRRRLARYLGGIAIFQGVLYAATAFDSVGFLVYFDPRLGLFALETIVLGREVYPAFSCIASVPILAGCAVWVWRAPAGLVAYFLVETILMAPSLYFFWIIVRANVDPSHGFSVGELVFPVLVYLVATAAPMALVGRLLATRGLRKRIFPSTA